MERAVEAPASKPVERAVEAPAQGASKPVERRGGASLGKKPWDLLSRSTKESSLLHLPAFVWLFRVDLPICSFDLAV